MNASMGVFILSGLLPFFLRLLIITLFREFLPTKNVLGFPDIMIKHLGLAIFRCLKYCEFVGNRPSATWESVMVVGAILADYHTVGINSSPAAVTLTPELCEQQCLHISGRGILR